MLGSGCSCLPPVCSCVNGLRSSFHCRMMHSMMEVSFQCLWTSTQGARVSKRCCAHRRSSAACPFLCREMCKHFMLPWISPLTAHSTDKRCFVRPPQQTCLQHLKTVRITGRCALDMQQCHQPKPQSVLQCRTMRSTTGAS